MKKVIGLIFGGQSHEHEVSLKSATTFLKKINYNEFSVIPFLITSEGRWIKYSEVTSPIDTIGQLWIDEEVQISPLLAWNNNIDVFFPLIHGETGEDGKIQGFLEILGVPYVGCDVESSAVGMNKVLAKEIANTLGGVSIVPYEIIRKREWLANNNINLSFEYPVFVKPSRAGSSVGVSKVYDEKSLKYALEAAFLVDNLVLIEKAIVGKEIEVGVVGSNGNIEVSPVGEISFTSDFYDYENKYDNDTSVMHIPARIKEEKQQEARLYASEVYQSLGCSGYARVDFFIENDTEKIYFNEINTSPGMTDKSMFPVLFSEKYNFSELLTNIINQAFERKK